MKPRVATRLFYADGTLRSADVAVFGTASGGVEQAVDAGLRLCADKSFVAGRRKWRLNGGAFLSADVAVFGTAGGGVEQAVDAGLHLRANL